MKFLYKLIYRGYRYSTGLWHWILGRFTPAGLCVLFGWLVAGAFSVDIENTVSYQLYALLFALLVFAVVCTPFFRARFSAVRVLPRFGTAGQPLHYQVDIRNLTDRPQTGLTLLDDLADPRPSFEDWLAFKLAESRHVRAFRISKHRQRHPFRLATVKPAEIPPVPARGEATVAMELMPYRRGVLRLKGVKVACADPLGIYRAFRRLPAPASILILPKRYPLPPIALPGQVKYQEGGVALAANVGCSEEFVSLRDYRHGDPLRHIHWRSWAKTGKPIVKEFEDEFFVRHALVLDTFTDETRSEVMEEAVSVAASFACTVITQESLLDLLFIGNQSYCFTAGRGLGTADQMLRILASVQNCGDKPFTTLEHLVFNHLPVVSGCICVFQKWDESRRQFVQKLKTVNVPVMILIVVPPGDGISGAGGTLNDAEGTVHVLEVGKIAEGLAKLR